MAMMEQKANLKWIGLNLKVFAVAATEFIKVFTI